MSQAALQQPCATFTEQEQQHAGWTARSPRRCLELSAKKQQTAKTFIKRSAQSLSLGLEHQEQATHRIGKRFVHRRPHSFTRATSAAREIRWGRTSESFCGGRSPFPLILSPSSTSFSGWASSRIHFLGLQFNPLQEYVTSHQTPGGVSEV